MEVGNLHQKDNSELKALLRRQMNILKNRDLMKKLPDGGAKVKVFATQLKSIIEDRGCVLPVSTVRLLHSLMPKEGMKNYAKPLSEADGNKASAEDRTKETADPGLSSHTTEEDKDEKENAGEHIPTTDDSKLEEEDKQERREPEQLTQSEEQEQKAEITEKSQSTEDDNKKQDVKDISQATSQSEESPTTEAEGSTKVHIAGESQPKMDEMKPDKKVDHQAIPAQPHTTKEAEISQKDKDETENAGEHIPTTDDSKLEEEDKQERHEPGQLTQSLEAKNEAEISASSTVMSDHEKPSEKYHEQKTPESEQSTLTAAGQEQKVEITEKSQSTNDDNKQDDKDISQATSESFESPRTEEEQEQKAEITEKSQYTEDDIKQDFKDISQAISESVESPPTEVEVKVKDTADVEDKDKPRKKEAEKWKVSQMVWFSWWIIIFVAFLAAHDYWINPCCLLTECCNERWVSGDYDGVKQSLDDNLFGQHLVHNVIYASLKGHVDSQPNKPLVLSFHGSTGTGKNFASQWIAKNWFKKGMDSAFVHFFSATKDFPSKSKTESYMTYLKGYVYQHTKSCGHQIFIFDEIDSIAPGLLNSIKTFLEYHEKVDGVDFRKTIFIFLSNIGEASLKNMTEDYYRKGKRRRDLKLVEAERVIVSEVFHSEDTGLSRSRLIDSNLISHFVPFLPLERRHVRECIRRELKRFHLEFDMDLVDEIMDELQFGGLDNIFSLKGCKNVAEKVNLVASPRQWKVKIGL